MKVMFYGLYNYQLQSKFQIALCLSIHVFFMVKVIHTEKQLASGQEILFKIILKYVNLVYFWKLEVIEPTRFHELKVLKV